VVMGCRRLFLQIVGRGQLAVWLHFLKECCGRGMGKNQQTGVEKLPICGVLCFSRIRKFWLLLGLFVGFRIRCFLASFQAVL
ncbi:MAG: hypothetical protein SVX43_13535, partial [Cyanobacteriota bacterium]|nr:hypothetical protein [Cyanobacteriota bacterium]